MSARRWLAMLAIFTIALMSGAPDGLAQERTLSFKQMHTGETLTVTYMRNGRYDQDGLRKINYMLRDWRRNESTTIDPKLIDIIWDVKQQTGSRAPVHVLSGYRSPVTNAALRSRSRGVAKNSQHTVGKALDFYLPDVPLSKLREVGLKMQRGGVGFYPSSGSPFVHLDTGSVRHWPRLSRQQLVGMFPDGKTLHLPSDGKPLAGYQTAKAELARRAAQPSAASSSGRSRLAFWRRDDAATGSTGASSSGRSRGLLAALFEGDEEEESTPTAQAELRSAPRRQAQPAAPQPAAPQPAAAPDPAPQSVMMASAPLPRARPTMEPAAPAEPVMAVAAAPIPLPRPEIPRSDMGIVTASLPAVLPRERPLAPRRQLAESRPPLSQAAREASLALAPSSSMADLPFSATFTESNQRLGERPAFYPIDTRPAAMRSLSTPQPAAQAAALTGLLHPDQSDLSDLLGAAESVIVNRFEARSAALGEDGFSGPAIRTLPIRSYRQARGSLPISTALAR